MDCVWGHFHTPISYLQPSCQNIGYQIFAKPLPPTINLLEIDEELVVENLKKGQQPYISVFIAYLTIPSSG